MPRPVFRSVGAPLSDSFLDLGLHPIPVFGVNGLRYIGYWHPITTAINWQPKGPCKPLVSGDGIGWNIPNPRADDRTGLQSQLDPFLSQFQITLDLYQLFFGSAPHLNFALR